MHGRMARRRRGRRRSPLRGARTRAGRRAATRSPCSAPATTSVFALVNRCPHKQGPAEPGHRPRRQRRLPAAQLDASRCATGEAQGDDKGCAPTIPVQVGRRARADLPRDDGGRSWRRDVTAVRTTCAYCGVGCGIAATRDGRARGRDQGRSRASRQSRPALLQGHASGRDGRARGPAAPSDDRRQAGRAGTRRSASSRAASPRRSPGTGPTASPSTSRASC